MSDREVQLVEDLKSEQRAHAATRDALRAVEARAVELETLIGQVNQSAESQQVKALQESLAREITARFSAVESGVEAVKAARADHMGKRRALVAAHNAQVRALIKQVAALEAQLKTARADLTRVKQLHAGEVARVRDYAERQITRMQSHLDRVKNGRAYQP